MIAIVAAVAKNNVIGKENDLPWYIPEDLKRFKTLTTGKTVLMGRKTFESILKRLGKPLPNRKNVVVTRDPNYTPPPLSSPIPAPEQVRHGAGKVEEQKGSSPPLVGGVRGGVVVYHSVTEALNALNGEDIMVAGGAEIYRQTLDRADTLYITHVNKEIDGDAFFPAIDPAKWKEVNREDHEGYSWVEYHS